MLWTEDISYANEPFQREADLEAAIQKVRQPLFGEHRIYLDTKRRIGARGKKQNIPDGYLIDLSSKREPRLYVVENELAVHQPLRHIAVQILEFSLAFDAAPQRVKEVVKASLAEEKLAWQACESYAMENGFENVDYLLERLIYPRDAFNALVIIDEMQDDLETVLMSRFKFPVEILTLKRFKSATGVRIYEFEPFLADISGSDEIQSTGSTRPVKTIDPAEIDTVVVPARADGFEETFIGEDCWYAIRMHSSMIPKIKHVAAYRVSPVSAITHVADVRSIEQWKDTNKYILYFSAPAREIGPIKLVSKGKVKAPQAPRYTSLAQLEQAENLDLAF